MRWSHSRVETAEKCLYNYRLRYLDGLKTIPPDNADNALVLGTALHTGIEQGVEAAVEQYYGAFPIITDEHITEAMKLENLIPKTRLLLAGRGILGGRFEVEVADGDFVGYIDFLDPTENVNEFDLYDFKYTANGSKYADSPQLHLYKWIFERLNPDKRIRDMYYLIVPKVTIKLGKTESLSDYRDRVNNQLARAEPYVMPVTYDLQKVVDYWVSVKRTLETSEYPKNPSYLCNWCEYQQFCEKGIDYMLLPKNERRNIEKVTKRVLWLYGAPFSGKTTFANKFDDPLMLNTDGNIKFVDAPYIPIRDEVKVEGRITKKTLAWEVFKGAVDELEKKGNEFKTIVVDLLEDLYEHCRLYMYQQMNITHESDDSFRAWDKVRTEFLSTLKRLMNLDYANIILISHEDTSKDLTRKGGDKITAIKPNLQEKTSNKVAGMVDIVARVVADGDTRTLSFKANEVIFGGGRLTASQNEIPLDYAAFTAVYDEANRAAVTATAQDNNRRSSRKETPPVEPPKDDPAPTEQADAPTETKHAADTPPETQEKPPTVRTRKRRNEN